MSMSGIHQIQAFTFLLMLCFRFNKALLIRQPQALDVLRINALKVKKFDASRCRFISNRNGCCLRLVLVPTYPVHASPSTRLYMTPMSTQASSTPWTQLGLVNELTDVVSSFDFESPTTVQQMVIPRLLQSQSLAFLAATGSGKTLAYALPLLQLLKSHETFDGYERRVQRPRLVVLAPTRELTVQIHSVIKSLCHSIKLSSVALVGGEDTGKQRRRLSGFVDIVVSTPGRLLKHWNSQNVFLGDVTHVVVDEMDTMLEQGFENDIKSILYPILYHKKPNQLIDYQKDYTEASPRLIMTSATLTQAVQKMLGDTQSLVNAKKHYQSTTSTSQETAQQSGKPLSLPQLRVLQVPGLHKALPQLKQTFVSVGKENKLSILVNLLLTQERGESMSTSSGLTMIFCNTAASCRAVQFALQESGISSLACHGELNSAMRMEQMNQFRRSGSGVVDPLTAFAQNLEKDPSILVCTDLVARGLDVPQVQQVIMFDFPLNSLDYLHRSGRTARGSHSGSVTALVTKRDQVLATAIQLAVERGDALDGLSSRKTDYLPGGRLHETTRSAKQVLNDGVKSSRGDKKTSIHEGTSKFKASKSTRGLSKTHKVVKLNVKATVSQLKSNHTSNGRAGSSQAGKKTPTSESPFKFKASKSTPSFSSTEQREEKLNANARPQRKKYRIANGEAKRVRGGKQRFTSESEKPLKFKASKSSRIPSTEHKGAKSNVKATAQHKSNRRSRVFR